MNLAAAIDLGSNAVRLSIAHIELHRPPFIVLTAREAVRLGNDVFGSGIIGDPAISQAISALNRFDESMRALGVNRVRAVATSAMREARNRDHVLQRLVESTGIPVEIIDGAEEARLSHSAARERLNLNDDTALFIDIGGGSAEASLTSGDSVIWSGSYPIGSVRLLLSPQPELECAAFQLWLRDSIERHAAGRVIASCIATGGSSDTIGQLKAAVAGGDPSFLSTDDMAYLYDAVQRVPTEERAARFALRPDKADVVLVALRIFGTVLETAGQSGLRIAFVGIRDGIFSDYRKAMNPDIH